jgi:uncharacterized protein (TIGR03086 family)
VDTLTALARTYDVGEDILSHLEVGDLTRPTVCPGWDLRQLLNHMVGAIEMFTEAASGGTPERRNRGDLIGDRPCEVFVEQATANLAAWRADTDFEVIHVPFGDLPPVAVAQANLVDTLAHVWDVARTIEVPMAVEPALAHAALEAAVATITPAMRERAAYGETVSVPHGASAFERFLGYTGRRAAALRT